MNAIDNARAALETWDDPDHDAWYDRNLIDPPHMVVNALRDLIAQCENQKAELDAAYGMAGDGYRLATKHAEEKRTLIRDVRAALEAAGAGA